MYLPCSSAECAFAFFFHNSFGSFIFISTRIETKTRITRHWRARDGGVAGACFPQSVVPVVGTHLRGLRKHVTERAVVLEV